MLLFTYLDPCFVCTDSIPQYWRKNSSYSRRMVGFHSYSKHQELVIESGILFLICFRRQLNQTHTLASRMHPTRDEMKDHEKLQTEEQICLHLC
jgi:hypothetical protein